MIMLDKSPIMLNNLTLVQEIKEGFDSIKVGNITFDMPVREGSDYLSFSNKCKVLATHEDSKFKVGDIILVMHDVRHQQDENMPDDHFFVYPNDVLGIKKHDLFDVQDDRYLENFTPVEGEFAEPIALNESHSRDFWHPNIAKTFSGKTIEYLKDSDYEIYHREKMYYHVPSLETFMVDGVIQPGFEEVKYKKGKFMKGNKEIVIQERFLQKALNGKYIMKSELVLGLVTI